MIRRVWSDLLGFKEAHFDDGFNVVLADTAEDSTETESTNGLGKTTLIRIIHFCFGSELARDRVLTHPDLAKATFGLDLQVGDDLVVVSRNIGIPKRVAVSSFFVASFSFEKEDIDAGMVAISLDDWRMVLSARFFPEARTEDNAYSPSFRELSLYFARLGKPAFTDPQLAFQGEPGAQKRLCLSFMLGLNWSLQRSIHDQIINRSSLSETTKALRSAERSTGQKSIGELEADRVALETLLRRKQAEIESFNVREDYRDLERRLTELDRRIHDTINENYADTRLRDHYIQSTTEMPDAEASMPVTILREAGAVFKEEALRRLDEVAAFHEQIYRNRRDFLKGEIRRLDEAISTRDSLIDQLSGDKQSLLGVLRTSGAIDTLIALQRSSNDLNARHEVLLAQIEQRKEFDRKADEISARIARDKTLLKNDLDDRKSAVDEVRALFADFTIALYGRPGRLGVDVGRDGYSFSFTIDREGSDGVDQMVVFCFDLTVASIWASRGRGCRLLIHDSTLFADVDPRQYAAALKLAAECAEKYGFQYICCLNAGSLPTEHLGEFDVAPFVKLRLTDEGPEGRLLGRKLPPQEKAAA
jgi:uncharacterized protein YydD (DUF2326 family)